MDADRTRAIAPPRPGEPGGPAIELIDLCKDFGSFRAVDHLTLTVRQGEIFGLLGPNGSGKTTVNMISGLSVPTSGSVRILGYDVRHQSREMRRLLGCVPQETALYEELTAWDNMDFHAGVTSGATAAGRVPGSPLVFEWFITDQATTRASAACVRRGQRTKAPSPNDCVGYLRDLHMVIRAGRWHSRPVPCPWGTLGCECSAYHRHSTHHAKYH
jgi:ABC-type sugar transport system ATPase subunit